ncbi:MAG TPA: Fe-S cluster assembly protein SufD [Vicinamibacterales bacterium]|nr:Fe-S cluster assembly protein SufD [Vicinamibacterales bacterium]
MTVAERHEALTATFEAFRRTPAFGTGPLAEARAAAFDRFLMRGFPTTRDEEWRFTNVAPIAALSYVQATPSMAVSALPPGVTSRPFRAGDALSARASATPFADLNTALFEGGLVIEVAPKTIVREPIELSLASAPGDEPVIASPRIRLIVGEQAAVTIVERYTGPAGRRALTNAVTEVTVGPGARVDHVKVQDEPLTAFHLASLFIRLERASAFRSHAITFGGRIARNDIVAVLDGEGAECTLNGLYIATGDSLVDTHTTIDHAKAHCPSHELYKGILAGKSRAVFNGKIIVRPDAQKTDAKQTNKALLLTDDAQVNTKPQLEIFADDVKCTHGAAIGQLDDDALFYLQARGIGVDEARHMLIEAFAGEVLDGIPVAALRESLMQAMEAKLARR